MDYEVNFAVDLFELTRNGTLSPENVAGKDIFVKNDSGLTALHTAVVNGYADIVEILLPLQHETDFQGNTPLHYAAFLGRKKCASLLIMNKHSKNKLGQTPRDLAILNNQHNIVILLTNK